jgi:hypothetical protein
MNKNIDTYYNQHIKPLSKNERLSIAKKILDDMEEKQQTPENERLEKIQAIKKLRGIVKNSAVSPSKEDWYKQ